MDNLDTYELAVLRSCILARISKIKINIKEFNNMKFYKEELNVLEDLYIKFSEETECI